MKKNNLLFPIILTFIVIITSCRKEQLTIDTPVDINQESMISAEGQMEIGEKL